MSLRKLELLGFCLTQGTKTERYPLKEKYIDANCRPQPSPVWDQLKVYDCQAFSRTSLSPISLVSVNLY